MTPVQRDRSHMDYSLGVVQGWNETVNRGSKVFKFVSHKDCHPIKSHGDMFCLVSNIVQIVLESGIPKYDMDVYID